MFSTLDRPTTRLLRVWLTTPSGEALVVFPEFDVQKSRVLSMPNPALLERVARQTAQREWYVYTYEQFAGLRGLPDAVQRQLERTASQRRRAREADSSATLPAPYPASIALTTTWSSPTLEAAMAAEVTAVRVEVWRLLYDADREQTASDLIAEATVPVR